MDIDLAGLEAAVNEALGEPEAIAVGDAVICQDNDEPVTYGGPDQHGSELVYVIGRGLNGMTVKCDVSMVAPADTPLPDAKDPRIQVVKTKGASWQGNWAMRVADGAGGHTKPTRHKTKKEAVAAGRRRLAIVDWHAKQAGEATVQHEYVEAADDKYSHLVTGSCRCGGWRTAGSMRPQVVKAGYDRHVAAEEPTA